MTLKEKFDMYTYNAKVEKIIDGDTVLAIVDLGFDTWKKVTIRLNGINTPESRTTNQEEKTKGLAAKTRLQQLLEINKNHFILISFGVDKYGRCLGELYLDLNTPSINNTLILEGHAVPYNGGKR